MGKLYLKDTNCQKKYFNTRESVIINSDKILINKLFEFMNIYKHMFVSVLYIC